MNRGINLLKNHTHRVGTITLGITLVLSGIAYLLHLFFPSITYYHIMKAWPIVFIFLGVEILLNALQIKDEQDIRYDKTAFFMNAMIILFTMFIGCISIAIEHAIPITFS